MSIEEPCAWPCSHPKTRCDGFVRCRRFVAELANYKRQPMAATHQPRNVTMDQAAMNSEEESTYNFQVARVASIYFPRLQRQQ